MTPNDMLSVLYTFNIDVKYDRGSHQWYVVKTMPITRYEITIRLDKRVKGRNKAIEAAYSIYQADSRFKAL